MGAICRYAEQGSSCQTRCAQGHNLLLGLSLERVAVESLANVTFPTFIMFLFSVVPRRCTQKYFPYIFPYTRKILLMWPVESHARDENANNINL